MYTVNAFHVLADISHTASKCVLIWVVIRNRTAEGISLITQALYTLVFCARYVDVWNGVILGDPAWLAIWNFALKIFYVLSSVFILVLMTTTFARTRERETAWRLGVWCLGGSVILAPIMTIIFKRSAERGFGNMLYSFSLILESVCILPQLLLLRQTRVPTVINSMYLLLLGAYRALYILNWIELDIEDALMGPGPIPVIFGIVQTILYIDFAWVYYTRQRVKLRNGGLVDSEDLRKGWIMNRILGNIKGTGVDRSISILGSDRTRAHSQLLPSGSSSNFGRSGRAISVSADEGGVLDRVDRREEQSANAVTGDLAA